MTYQKGFDYSAFEYLGKSQFHNLKQLNMVLMDLDADIIFYFLNWKLPSL